MPKAPLTETEIRNRQTALMNHLAKQGKPIPKAATGANINGGTITGAGANVTTGGQVIDLSSVGGTTVTLPGGTGSDTLKGTTAGTAGANVTTAGTVGATTTDLTGGANYTYTNEAGGEVTSADKNIIVRTTINNKTTTTTILNPGYIPPDTPDTAPKWVVINEEPNAARDGRTRITEEDQNPNSPTFGTTQYKWEGEQQDKSADWVEIGSVDNGDGTTTLTFRDDNPYSPTYGKTMPKDVETTTVSGDTSKDGVKETNEAGGEVTSADEFIFIHTTINGKTTTVKKPNPAYIPPKDTDDGEPVWFIDANGIVTMAESIDAVPTGLTAYSTEAEANNAKTTTIEWYIDADGNVVSANKGEAPEGVIVYTTEAAATAALPTTTAAAEEELPEGAVLKYQLPQNDGSVIYIYQTPDGELHTRQGPPKTGINSLVFNPNDPRGYNAQMAIDPHIVERGIYRHQGQVYDPATEGMRGSVGGLPIYEDVLDAEGKLVGQKIVGYTEGTQKAFLDKQTADDIPSSQKAGTPVLDPDGKATGEYTTPQAAAANRQKPIYDAQGNVIGYTAGMQANLMDAQQIGAPIIDPNTGKITGYTNQVATQGQQRLQPIMDDAGNITGYTADAALTRQITAPTDTTIDPETGLPITTKPAPSEGAKISKIEAQELVGDTTVPSYKINATDLPDRTGMIADKITFIYDDDGNIIGAIPAGAELPTAATVSELGEEAFALIGDEAPQITAQTDAAGNILRDDEGNPIYSYTSEAATREQAAITTKEEIVAQIGTDPDNLTGLGIIESALAKGASELEVTELEAAKAVAKTLDLVGDLATKFPAGGMFPTITSDLENKGAVAVLDTVRGQLASLMADFENDEIPDWAAGSIRVANQIMAERGLGNSSIAAATIVQAAQEAALPIAQADAQVYANMNLTNLSNRTKYALDNAAAARNFRLSDLSNEQQTALSNSAQAYSLLGAELSNSQEAALANAQMKNALQEQDLNRSQQEQIVNAARYAELENINLTHEQQTRIANGTNNLQVDVANLSSKEKAVLAELQVQAALEGQELDNIQQTNIIKASRYAEASNLDFTAEQNRIFSNSKMVETIALDDLEFEQARTLQNAANYAALDMADLNNRQQAQVENARNFLQMDLANLSNDQQAAILDAQGLQQFMLTDAAAENAARQFNATSQNQVDQFFEGMAADISKHNSNLMAAMQQYNAGQENAMRQYNSTMANQREQFNSTAALEIEQANVNYRRELNTLNTAGANLEAQALAENYFNISQQAMSNVWQDYRDTTNYAYNQAQNDKDRSFNLAMALMQKDQENAMFANTVDYNTGMALGNMAIGVLATISDIRLKTNIVKEKMFDNGLGWYTWEWNDTAKELGYGNKPTTGFVAQEVSEIYPDAIVEKDNGYLAVMFDDVLRRSENA